jgi:oligopeptide transport system substrate-binding protein
MIKRTLALLVLFILVARIQTNQVSASEKFQVPLNQALVLAGGESTNPRNYDPATTLSSGDKLAFSGLVSFDPNLNLTPDLAEAWDVSADATIFTFHLRANAKFHNGRAVTAQDVIYSWERAASPQLKSDTVLTYLGDIVGVKEIYSGQAEHITGLKATSDD